VLEAALEYAGRGLLVFPCGADKAPRSAHGFHDASSDEGQVRDWWAVAPDSLVGIAVPEGVIVVDMDPRNGGGATAAALARQHAPDAFPATRKAKTGSGGTHRWYTADPELRLRGRLGVGIDVKRAGTGYVIVPPSVSESGPYTWVDEREPVPAPEWMVEALLAPERVERAGRESQAMFPFAAGTAYGERALELELGQLRESVEGERNDALNRSTFAMAQLVAGGELREADAREQLVEAGLELGLEEREVEMTVESAFGAGLQEPRSAPERERRPPVHAVHTGERRWLDLTGDIPPRPPFVLWPIIPENAYVLIYGAAEAAKSMVFAGLCAEASRRGIRSSYYQLENGEAVEHRRFTRLGADPDNVRVSVDYLDMGDDAVVDELIQSELEFQSRFIVVDTYAHAYWSRAEDGNARAIEFARIVRRVMRETQVSVVVLDHVGYENQDEPRDASAKRQQVDTSALMKRTRDWAAGEPMHFSMRCTKSSRFENPYEFRGRVVDVGDGMELDWDQDAAAEMEWEVPK
jgi:hypothetical protein